MKREDMIMTLVINHMEDRKLLETSSDEELVRLMKCYREDIEDTSVKVVHMGKYAVVAYYSFDSETVVYLFDDYKAACEYMEKMWQHCYNSELAIDENGIDTEGTYHEEDYAQIKWKDEENITRIWQVVGTSEPMQIN